MEHLADPASQQRLKEKILALADSDFMNDMLAEKVLDVNIRDALFSIAKKEKHTTLRVFKRIAEYFAKNIPIGSMIENKIAEIDVAEAEEIILSVTGRELRVIVMLGGVLGFIIGLMVSIL